MPSNKTSVIMISRLLTPENRAELLAWVRLAYVAETSVRKPFGFDPGPNGTFSRKPQEYSCENIGRKSKRGKK